MDPYAAYIQNMYDDFNNNHANLSLEDIDYQFLYIIKQEIIKVREWIELITLVYGHNDSELNRLNHMINYLYEIRQHLMNQVRGV